ncbi:ATP-binding protein [Pseudomonas syringae]|uniref:ATP-binding protein n=1 Tax=Pseudomonas syringae TaxID=317 RepID=UPI002009F25E|nr:ATP-binding protein [Pseudomonas syringae]MCK9744347.1 ATP-binding protein [Pseudomonas syringae pv. syringae]MCK9768064.1 ATP-binding protein [Pseudomonas syringae pv. syringae]
MTQTALTFDDATIEKLFGNEAADYEDIERLREYYLKGKVYNRVAADLPLRIVVGHKGIGKSALIRYAMYEDNLQGILSILVKPDDVLSVAKSNVDFLQRIKDWETGLTQVIATKALEELGIGANVAVQTVSQAGGKLLNLLHDSISGLLSKAGVTLQPAKESIARRFLENKRIRVYVDDLDRGWAARKDEINRISTLLGAVMDMCKEYPGLQFRVALRSDVYFLYRTSDESTDKTEGSVVWFSWTQHEILALLVKRIETFFGRPTIEKLESLPQKDLARFLSPVMEERFSGAGKWENAPIHRVLMTLIRKRPRDLVKICTLAARHAHDRGQNKIYSEDFEAIFEEYSQGRSQDTFNEYKSELPQIQRLIEGMRPTTKEIREGVGWIYNTDALLKKLGKVVEQGSFTFASGSKASTKELAQFLYKINFLVARKDHSENGPIERKYFEENRYISSEFRDFGYSWEVHPAFRKHLQPESFFSLSKNIALTAEDPEKP